MRLLERQVIEYQPFCDWCGINVGAWYSNRMTMLRILVMHRRLHRKQERVGRSIRAVDYP